MAKTAKRQPKQNHKAKLHVKTGDTVMVITGKNKGQTGIVKKIDRHAHRVVVDGLNMMKKAVKPNPQFGQQGGIIEMEAPLQASNVMLYCNSCSKPTRLKMDVLGDGKKTRVCKHCQAQFD